ncbi:MAG: LptF/LptG family permease [Chlamydiales bacterium]
MIIYRYLLIQYLGIFSLCVGSFVFILFSTRLDEIAHFAAYGTGVGNIIKFCLFQIPYILPIVIPIACLISSIVLIHHLSISQEITALRAGGFSLKQIVFPILMASILIGLLNIYITSELATSSHLSARRLENELKKINPLLIIQNKHSAKIKDIFITALSPSDKNTSLKDAVVGFWDKHHKRINLLIAKELNSDKNSFMGEDLSLIATVDTEDSSGMQHLILENMKTLETSIDNFGILLKQQTWRRQHSDYLRTALVLQHLKKQWEILKDPSRSIEEHQKAKATIRKTLSEVVRRISIALAAVSFTLLGLSFGMSIGRSRSVKGPFIVTILAATYLICYFIAKGSSSKLGLAIVLYLLPHAAIIGSSILSLRKISRGIE